VFPDKARPFVKTARKAAGLISKLEIAELPKVFHFGEFGFFVSGPHERVYTGEEYLRGP
jgi:hypothetical protein